MAYFLRVCDYFSHELCVIKQIFIFRLRLCQKLWHRTAKYATLSQRIAQSSFHLATAFSQRQLYTFVSKHPPLQISKISVCLPFTRLLLQQTRGCAADNSSCLLALFRAIIYQKTPGEFPALSPGSSAADRFTEVTHRYTHNTRVALYKHPGAQ